MTQRNAREDLQKVASVIYVQWSGLKFFET